MVSRHGTVNLSKSGLFEGGMTRPKSLKVRRWPRVRISQNRVNPVKLTMPSLDYQEGSA